MASLSPPLLLPLSPFSSPFSAKVSAAPYRPLLSSRSLQSVSDGFCHDNRHLQCCTGDQWHITAATFVQGPEFICLVVEIWAHRPPLMFVKLSLSSESDPQGNFHSITKHSSDMSHVAALTHGSCHRRQLSLSQEDRPSSVSHTSHSPWVLPVEKVLTICFL